MKLSKYPQDQTQLADLRAGISGLLLDNAERVGLISPTTKIHAQGSCFAENIAKVLSDKGMDARYLPMAEAINSPLANRSFFEHLLNPSLGYQNPKDRKFMPPELLQDVRDRLPNDDLFIFTLGVGPCFFKRGDARPTFFPPLDQIQDYEMRQTSVAENEEALAFIIDAVRKLNPRIKVVLTVSPVPLSRSYNLGSAVVADCVSKSTLRMAVSNTMIRKIPSVYYWPSFEIVRWLVPHLYPAYGKDDKNLRHVNADLVSLIVDLFLEYFGI